MLFFIVNPFMESIKSSTVLYEFLFCAHNSIYEQNTQLIIDLDNIFLNFPSFYHMFSRIVKSNNNLVLLRFIFFINSSAEIVIFTIFTLSTVKSHHEKIYRRFIHIIMFVIFLPKNCVSSIIIKKYL